MKEVMAQAQSGDDVYGEDESIIELENEIAIRTGKEKNSLCYNWYNG